MNCKKKVAKIKDLLEDLLRDSTKFDSRSALISEIRKIADSIEKDLELNINEQEDFLNATLNHIPDPIFIKDINHRWVFLNDSACKLFGYSRDELIGKSDYDIFLKEEADEYWKIDNQVFESGKEIRNEEFQTHPITGKRRIIDTKKVLHISAEGNKYILGIIRDITELKEAKTNLIREVQGKQKIFSLIAHDLKEPFSSLMGSTSLLYRKFDELDDGKKKEFIKNIDNVAKNSYRFIQNILDWTATKTGQIRFMPEQIKLKSVVNDIISFHSEIARSKNIKIEISLYDEEQTVYADLYLLSAIIRNLLSNALKYTETGGRVTISTKKAENNSIQFCIADTGIGVPEKDRNNLFRDASDDIDANPNIAVRGMGLGLVLSREFVERNKGKIWFEPNSPKGSVFCFTVPERR